MPKVIKWKLDHIITIYELSREGLKQRQIRRVLGVSEFTWKAWKKRYPVVLEAIRRARNGGNLKPHTFRDYVYARLSPEVREIWDRINECEDTPNGIRRLELLTENNGKTTNQRLFLHALTASGFNVSEACRITNISFKKYNLWKNTDPEFAELVDEIFIHQKNFYHGALNKLVEEGDPNAIIFANRTINRDRGFSEKLEVEMSGQVNLNHNVILMDDLRLPLEVRKQILEACRRNKEASENNGSVKSITHNGNTVSHARSIHNPTQNTERTEKGNHTEKTEKGNYTEKGIRAERIEKGSVTHTRDREEVEA